MRAKVNGRIAVIGTTLFSGVMAAILLLPLAVVVAVAFDGTGYLEFPPRDLTSRNVSGILSSPLWQSSLLHSLEASGIATLLAATAGVLGAIGLREVGAKRRNAVLGLMVAPLILPTIVLGIGQDYVFTRFGIAGSVLGIGVGQSVLGFPIVLLLTVSGLWRVSSNLDDAAKSLGAGWLRRTLLVTLPPIWRYIVAGIIFAFLASFDDLILALFLSGPLTATLPVTLWNNIQFEATPTLGAVAALILCFAIGLMALGSVVQRARR